MILHFMNIVTDLRIITILISVTEDLMDIYLTIFIFIIIQAWMLEIFFFQFYYLKTRRHIFLYIWWTDFGRKIKDLEHLCFTLPHEFNLIRSHTYCKISRTHILKKSKFKKFSKSLISQKKQKLTEFHPNFGFFSNTIIKINTARFLIASKCS